MFLPDGKNEPQAFIAPAPLAAAMAEFGDEVPFQKGKVLVSNQSHDRDVYWIRRGKVQVNILSPSGRETILRIIDEGHCFGEMSAIDGFRRSANVIALTDGVAMRLSEAAFLTEIRKSSELALWLLRQYTHRVRELTDRIYELSTYSVGVRLHCELLRLVMQAGIERGPVVLRKSPTHAELSARIGTNRESVTREMRALATAGIIQQKGRSLTILDVAALRAMVAHTIV